VNVEKNGACFKKKDSIESLKFMMRADQDSALAVSSLKGVALERLVRTERGKDPLNQAPQY
jgi:hypothetical protein